MTQSEQHGWYLSAPWNPVLIRRGDALGLRAGADYFADLLAPDLSNAISDARWISLLSWCLKWSHAAWAQAGGGDLSRRDDQRARYAWLRPLELMWVDRTLQAGQTTGQLRGRRSIERWRRAERRLPDFAMSADQFRRYRQIGMYGAYRVVLRNVRGLTTGDGWTPGATGLELADLVNDSLPREARLKQANFENGTKWGHWASGEEARYWVERGWEASAAKKGGYLPTPDSAAGEELPSDERRLLEPALFSADSTRRVVAEALAQVKGARSHADLCEGLITSSLLAKHLDPGALAPLPAFTRFADTAMHAVRVLWHEINNDGVNQAPATIQLAKSAQLQDALNLIREAGAAWLGEPTRELFPHEAVVSQLAEAVCRASSPLEQIRALARHHHEHGGGRRWFREQGGKMIPLVAASDVAASDYRFRLLALSRLAAQCGVAKMNATLAVVTRNEFDGLARDEPDEEDELL
ncbi:hypothetical protein [Variovorax sp. YR566]|uniref:hypothetical protein n=1 Tax=Variovorax sp. YR566 TaxID=3450237 RepID=UPI003F7D2550